MEAVSLSLFLAALAAIGAAVSAVGANRSATATRRAAEANLLSGFLDAYAADAMADDLRRLRGWKEDRGNSWLEDYRTGVEKGNVDAVAVDLSRRHLAHFFMKALRLYERGYVEHKFLTEICDLDGIGVLYDIVVPLEYALNPDFCRETFDRLRELCGKREAKSRIRSVATTQAELGP